MLKTPANLVSMTIEDRTWSAPGARLICRGASTGPLAYVPAGPLEGQARRGEKRIFVCDSPSTALRPLLPDALGFVFGTGETLGHFAGVLRRHRIPACIDLEMWQRAKAAALDTTHCLEAQLFCGEEIVLPPEAVTQYQARLMHYQERLESRPLVLPVYQVCSRSVISGQKAIHARLGEKALVVNALKVDGLPTPKALILTGLEDSALRLDKDPTFKALLSDSFTEMGTLPGYTLIARGSLHSEDGSHSAWSGSIKSPSVTSLEGLASKVAEQVAGWQVIKQSAPHTGFAIIVQERIPHPVRGILGTGRPWDYSSEGLVAELTFEHEDGEVYSLVFLDNLEADLLDGSLRTAAQLWAIENPTLDEEQLCLALGNLVESAKNLQKLHDVPLDIEFVVTSEWKIVFVQLRPLFRL